VSEKELVRECARVGLGWKSAQDSQIAIARPGGEEYGSENKQRSKRASEQASKRASEREPGRVEERLRGIESGRRSD